MLAISVWSNYALIQIQTLCQSPFNVFLLVEHIDPTTSSPALAVVWTPEGIAGTVVGTVVVIVVVIALVIAVVIAVVIAFEKKRKKKGYCKQHFRSQSNVLIVAASN